MGGKEAATNPRAVWRIRTLSETKQRLAHSLHPRRVTNLLKAWVREYMDHEDLDRDLLNRIRDFALSSMTEKGQALQICKSVDERVSRSTALSLETTLTLL